MTCTEGHGFDSRRGLRFFLVPRSRHVDYSIFSDICIVGSFSWLFQYSLRHNDIITVTSKDITLKRHWKVFGRAAVKGLRIRIQN